MSTTSARSLRRVVAVLGISLAAAAGTVTAASAAPTRPADLTVTKSTLDEYCLGFTVENSSTSSAPWSKAAYWQKMRGIEQTYVIPPLAAGQEYTVYRCYPGPGWSHIDEYVGDQEFTVDQTGQVPETDEDNNHVSF